MPKLYRPQYMVVNGTCTACFTSVCLQMPVEVKKGQNIITCESCTRILIRSLKNRNK